MSKADFAKLIELLEETQDNLDYLENTGDRTYYTINSSIRHLLTEIQDTTDYVESR